MHVLRLIGKEDNRTSTGHNQISAQWIFVVRRREQADALMDRVVVVLSTFRKFGWCGRAKMQHSDGMPVILPELGFNLGMWVVDIALIGGRFPMKSKSGSIRV